MSEKDSCTDNKYFLAFFAILIILIALVFCITVISARLPTGGDAPDSGAALESKPAGKSLGCFAAKDKISEEAGGPICDRSAAAAESAAVESASAALAIVFPLDGKITSLFSYRTDPFYDPESGVEPTCEFHRGIDISASKSRDIRACSAGVVTYAGYDSSYGYYIMIEHEGFTSLYAHCDTLLRSAGDRVSAGESIAVAGSTGRSTGPHLHFEIRVDGAFIDPLDFVGCVYTGTMY